MKKARTIQPVPRGYTFFTTTHTAAVRLDYDGLCSTAAQALASAGVSQSEAARRLGVSPGAVSRAVKEPGAKLSALQIRIVEAFTPYRVTETTIFLLEREAG